MLNENKIKMMTKMAIYEKHNGRKMIQNAKYYKGDFVALGILRTLIATTAAYLIIVTVLALCNIETIVAEIDTIDYTSIAKILILLYIMMVIIFTVIAGFVYAYQYEQSRKGLKRYFSRLNKLERFYNGQKKRK